ncbi:Uncharacterised protein g10304 [Pycnogonum litorale]
MVPQPSFGENFLSDPARNWRTFLKEWKSFKVCAGVHSMSKSMQFHTFMTSIGKTGRSLFDGFQFEEGEDKESVEVAIKKFDDYCLGTQTEISLRADFYRRIQQEGKTTTQFISDLFRLAENCNFADKDNMIRDKIALGIKGESLRERIFRQHKLTLNKIVDMCRTDETARAQALSLKTGPVQYVTDLNSEVCIVKKQSGEEKHYDNNYHNSVSTNKNRNANCNINKFRSTNRSNVDNNLMKCGRCGYTHNRQQCPVKGQTCHSCNRLNHFANVCRTRSKPVKSEKINGSCNQISSNDHQINACDHNSSQVFDAFSVDSKNKNVSPPIFANMVLDAKRIKFQVDTGDTINILPFKLLSQKHMKIMTHCGW